MMEPGGGSVSRSFSEQAREDRNNPKPAIAFSLTKRATQ